MVWFVLMHLVGLIVDLIGGVQGKADEKDLEIALLRHQVRLLQRRSPRSPRLTRWEKLTLAALTSRLARTSNRSRSRLAPLLLLVQPATVLTWHRELVRRKWTFRRWRAGGRPRIAAEVETLLLRLAAEHPRRGDGRLQGELATLGHALGRATVRDVLKRQRVPPAPLCGRRASTWRQFLAQHRAVAPACDCCTGETLFLKTLHVVFFLEIGTRRVHLAGYTAHPTAAWVTPQARQRAWALQDTGTSPRYLIHDRDATFPAAFDAVFASEVVEIVRTPYRAPNANAYAERWVRSVREECLDHLLIAGEAHLRRVLTEYVACYNQARPHQGLEQRCPVALPAPVGMGQCTAAIRSAACSTTIIGRRPEPIICCRMRFPHGTGTTRPRGVGGVASPGFARSPTGAGTVRAISTLVGSHHAHRRAA